MKKLMNYAALTVTIIAFLGTSILQGQEWTKEQKEVWQVVETGWEQWQKNDLENSFTSIHEKYLGWNSDTPLPITKEKWMKSYEEMKDIAKLEYYDIEPARILVYENIAVVHYYFESQIVIIERSETNSYKYKGKNSEFYIKENGNWFLIGDMTIWNSK